MEGCPCLTHSSHLTSLIQEATAQSHCMLSVLSKLLEKHVHVHAHAHEKPTNWSPRRVSHSVPNSGVLLVANLPPELYLLLLTTGTEYLIQDLTICTVFDFSKAFDTVPYRPLLRKLGNLNIHPYILTHQVSYRQQYVCLSNSTSCLSALEFFKVLSLGPCCSLSTWNDITTIPLSDGNLYADDILLYRPIYTPDYHHL